jgi:hypothetical protein
VSLVLLAPAGLLAGLALLLPLLAHLQRASGTQRVDFAALRWLRARLRPRRRLRWREAWLLCLRLALVALVALLFAQPAWVRADAARARIYLAPGVPLPTARAAARDVGAPAEWRQLTPGLPLIDGGTTALPSRPARSPGEAPSRTLSSLLREADARTPPGARLVVLVPPLLPGLDAERPRLAHAVDWRVLAAGGATARVTDARVADARHVPPPTLAIRHAGAQAPAGLGFLRAAAAGWARPGEAAALDVAASARAPAEGAWLAWLGPGDLPADLRDWVARGGVALRLPSAGTAPAAGGVAAWRRADGTVLARTTPLGRGRIVQLMTPLTAGALPELLEPTFPQQLRRLFAGPEPPPRLAPADALRPRTGGPRFPLAPDALAPWLALVAAFAFLCERLLATRATRGASR